MLRLPATLFSLLILSGDLYPVSAKPGHGHRRPNHYDNILNQSNDRYTVNLTVAGVPVNVMLDTGSTDMYVDPPKGIKASTYNNTGVYAAIYYGDGTNYVNGTVGLGLVDIAGHQIPMQAFIKVTNSVGEEGDREDGIFGLVGLGFDGPDGSIPAALSSSGEDGEDLGKSVLANIFDQEMGKERFFALSLSRAGDRRGSAEASLSIGEYSKSYTDVQYAPMLPQYPENSGAWSILYEGMSVNGKPIAYKADKKGSPSSVLLDSGTSNFLLPNDLVDAIYGAVPGAVIAKNSTIPNTKWSADEDVWVVPCETAVNVSVSFGGQDFPIHPLDITDLTVLIGPDGKNYTICTGSITNGGDVVNRNAIFGDSFLRNTYTVFAFGNKTQPPYIQLLSQTQRGRAARDFARVRSNLLDDSPPELSPRDVINLFDFPTPEESGRKTSGKASVDLADDASSSSGTNSQVAKYGPIIVGLLGANLVVLIVLVCLALLNCVRTGRSEGPSRALGVKYAPVKFKETESSRFSADGGDRLYSQ
ncbi:aspartic peptidase domain-containing protein [Mycena rebaudengoi]|nr:aspartic peptidase domain-containing protein [Mycena rebaudengoi]